MGNERLSYAGTKGWALSSLPPHHLEKATDALGILGPEHVPHSAGLATWRPEPLPIQA